MCFGGGSSAPPAPRDEVREEKKQAEQEEQEKKIKRSQEALDKQIEMQTPIKTSSFYDDGGVVYKRRVGKGSLFTSSMGGGGFLQRGRKVNQSGLRTYKG
jgi:hypothetical protein